MSAGVASPPPPSYILEPVAVWDDNTPLEDDEVEVPFYKEVEFAAGEGRSHALEINGRRVRYGKASLRSAGIDPTTAACAKNNGNSMEPLIQDGSLIGIDRAKTQIVDGEIYALDHDGMLRVKYVYRLPGGGLRLRSFNSDEHPDETYQAEEAAKIRILGWVWTWSPRYGNGEANERGQATK
jgi:phage repressor protein C with HTH and peptisase S24 domain